MSEKLIEYDNSWELSLVDRNVTGLYIDYGYTIDLYKKDDTISIRISNKFELYINEKSVLIDPKKKNEVGQALDVFNKTTSQIKAFKDGSLLISFINGDYIKVKVSYEFESWTIARDDGMLIVSQPGNAGLAVWLPSKQNVQPGPRNR